MATARGATSTNTVPSTGNVTAANEPASDGPNDAPAEVSPLAAYRLSDEQKEFVYETWQVGMAACMRERGFVYDPVRLSDVPDPTIPATADAAQQYGYDFPPGSDEPFHTTNDDRIAADDAYRTALLGNDGTPGCSTKTQRQVNDEEGAFGPLDSQVGEAVSSALDQAAATEEYRALNNDWSACMSVEGFDYSEPSEPLAQYQGGDTTSVEITTRIVDLACQTSVHFDQRLNQLANGFATEWINANLGVLQAWTTERDSYFASLRDYREQLGLPAAPPTNPD